MRETGTVLAATALAMAWQGFGLAQEPHAGHEQEADGGAPDPRAAEGHEEPAQGGMSGPAMPGHDMQEHMVGQGMQDCPMMQGETMPGRMMQGGEGCLMMQALEGQDAEAGADAHAGHDAAPVAADHAGHDMAATTGALGIYPMGREASGTAWSPDVTPHAGVHAGAGGWDLMGHLLLNGVYDWQDGPRGDEKAFLSGMVMGSARRTLGERNTLQLRAMLSPDPFMGKSGYPLLLASGETADGATPLVDRQHPHDLVMELSASVSRQLSPSDSVFVYAGLPGEPAFGPPAFMHRASILDSPEAPISHHWLDSTHITFGVVTAGWVHDDWKIEASRFRGREPDEHRFDIETGDLDSTAVRLSWNLAPEWSLQASWADATSPEQLEPDANQEKWSTTLAWGRRSGHDDAVDAVTLESAVRRGPWTLFARAERTENPELELGGGHGEAHTVAKASIGAVRDFQLSEHVALGLGALYAANVVPDDLEASYGGDPSGAMAFVRLKIE